MTDTPVIPQNSAPPVPQPLSPPPPPDALQQYRIEQLEKALEKLEGKQHDFEAQTTQNLSATVYNQTAMYTNHLDTVTHILEIAVFVLLAGGGVLGWLGYKNIKKGIKRKVENAIKAEVAGIKEEINTQSAKTDKKLEAQRQYEEGNRALDKKDYAEAIRHYDRSISFFSTSVAYINRGIAKHKLGRNEEAIADYNEALRIKPDYAEAYVNRALAKIALYLYKEAIADCNQALHLKPDIAEAYYNRGIAKHKLGRNEEAIADYNEALRIKPDLANAYFNKACAYALWGKPDEALKALEKAIAADTKWREQAKTDEDFTSLRDDPRFKKLVGLE